MEYDIFYPNIVKYLHKQSLDFASFYGYALFADISGFTHLSEQYMKEEIVGAEKIRDIINNHFKDYVKIIHKNNGDIIQFSGDAILSIFSSFQNAKTSAEEIIKKTSIKNTIGIKCGIGEGKIKIKLFYHNNIPIYLCHGEAITNALQAEKRTVPMSFEFQIKKNNKFDIPRLLTNKNLSVHKGIEKILFSFGTNYGKFSFVSSLFLLFPHNIEYSTIDQIISDLPEDLYINKIEEYPEGIRIFFLSGTPVGIQNPSSLIYNYLSKIRKFHVRGGISSGYVYTGITGGEKRVEFNILGNTINRAARIAGIAKENEILTDKKFLERIENIPVKFRGTFDLKGIGKTKLYCIEKNKQSSLPLYQVYYGRKKEKQLFLTLIEKQTPFIKIGGENGTGKTHFLSSIFFENTIKHEYYSFVNIDKYSRFSILEKLGSQITSKTILSELSKEDVFYEVTHILSNKNTNIFIFDNGENADDYSIEILKNINIIGKTIIFADNSPTGNIILYPFTKQESKEIIKVRSGTFPSERLLKQLYTASNGIPYMLLSLFKHLLSSGKIALNHRKEWDIKGNKIGLSPDISSFVSILFDSISAKQQNILKAASVTFFPFSYNYIKTTVSLYIDMGPLISREILKEENNQYLFSNPAIKDGIYESLSLKERNKYHLKAYKYFKEKNDFAKAGLHAFYANKPRIAAKYLSHYKQYIDTLQFSLALLYLKHYLQICPQKNKTTALYDTIVLLLEEGEIVLAKEILKKNKTDRKIYLYLKSLILISEDKRNEALKTLMSLSNKKIQPFFQLMIFDKIAKILSFTDKKRAIIYADKAYDILQKYPFEDNIYFRLGIPVTYRNCGQTDKAMKYLNILLKKAQEKQDKIKIALIKSMIVVVAPSTQFPTQKRIQIAKEALQQLSEAGIKTKVQEQYANLALYLKENGQYKEAIKMYNKAIEIACEINNSYKEALSINNLANLLADIGKEKDAEQLYLKTIEISQKNNYLDILEKGFGNLGVIYHLRKDYPKAYEMYEKALNTADKAEHSRSKFLWIINLSLLGVETNDFESTDFYLNLAREEIKQSGMEDRWIDIEQIAGNCYFLQGKYDVARETLSPVVKESLKRGEIDIYLESGAYYAGSMILSGEKKEGYKLLNKIKSEAQRMNFAYLLNTVIKEIEAKLK